jgi:tripartite-type tricarboxylate transporter receptor subunit TctC
MIECGLPSLTTVTHYGLFGLARVPADVVAKLNGEMNEALEASDVRASMLSVGIEPTGGSPQNFAAVIAQQLQQWGPLAKATRFRMD